MLYVVFLSFHVYNVFCVKRGPTKNILTPVLRNNPFSVLFYCKIILNTFVEMFVSGLLINEHSPFSLDSHGSATNVHVDEIT